MWSCGCSFTTFFLFLGTCSWTWTWVSGYLGTWVPGHLGTWAPGHLGVPVGPQGPAVGLRGPTVSPTVGPLSPTVGLRGSDCRTPSDSDKRVRHFQDRLHRECKPRNGCRTAWLWSTPGTPGYCTKVHCSREGLLYFFFFFFFFQVKFFFFESNLTHASCPMKNNLEAGKTQAMRRGLFIIKLCFKSSPPPLFRRALFLVREQTAETSF